ACVNSTALVSLRNNASRAAASERHVSSDFDGISTDFFDHEQTQRIGPVAGERRALLEAARPIEPDCLGLMYAGLQRKLVQDLTRPRIFDRRQQLPSNAQSAGPRID